MNAKCEICDRYYSIPQTRGTKLSNIRCRKDNGKLKVLSYSDNGLKDRVERLF